MHENKQTWRSARRLFGKLIGLACLTLGLVPGTSAAAYPEKQINMIIAYAPGGGSDLIARMLAPYIEKELGNGAKIVVLNRPGAGGAIGFAELARAAPDGYTIGVVNTPNLLTIPIERKVPFSWQSFDLIGNIVDDPGNFTVHADSPIKNLQDLAVYAREKKSEVTVGTTGSGSDDHLAMLLFQKAIGVEMTHVPYKGAAEVRSAMAGQQIIVGATNIGEALGFIKGGARLRNLGVMSPARTALAPDVPTFKEQGYDINLASLRGLAAPKGLPPEIRERLIAATERAIADPKFQAQAASVFAPLRYIPPQKYEAEMREGEAQFRQLWKDMPWADK
ncbi:MAG: tripartite tricarboxylate transporter substrate binding protein [Herminiimonas sp.]|nr:tripartite tricarboxylate transporter substrate binding protein [Herminiimonas sp.]